MPTQHDKIQDAEIQKQAARLANVEESIRLQTKILEQIRNFHMPWSVSEKRTKFHKRYVRPILKIGAAITLSTGLIKGGGAYFESRKVSKMAERYAQVADRLYFEENNTDVAVEFLQKATDLRSGNPEYRFRRAFIEGSSIARRLGDLTRPFTPEELDKAHRVYAEGVFLQQLEPERFEPFVLQGQILTALKEFSKAESAFNQADALSPSNAFVLGSMTELYYRAGRFEDADMTINRAYGLKPKSRTVLLWKGILEQMVRKDSVAAREWYDKALSVAPSFDRAWYNRGWTFVTAKDTDYEAARQNMFKALEINPQYPDACYAIGKFYEFEDKHVAAKVWLDKAIAMDRNSMESWKWRAIVKTELGDAEGALADVNSAIMLDARNADLYVQRAKAYLSLKKYEQAFADLNYARELDPNSKHAALTLGDCCLAVGQTSLALEHYLALQKQSPKYDAAYAGAARAYLALGKTCDAKNAIDKAVELARYRVDRMWLGKARILEEANERDAALECYVKARSLWPSSADAWRGEARVRLAKGDREGAGIARNACLKIVPHDPEMKGLFK